MASMYLTSPKNVDGLLELTPNELRAAMPTGIPLWRKDDTESPLHPDSGHRDAFIDMLEDHERAIEQRGLDFTMPTRISAGVLDPRTIGIDLGSPAALKPRVLNAARNRQDVLTLIQEEQPDVDVPGAPPGSKLAMGIAGPLALIAGLGVLLWVLLRGGD